MKRPESRQPFYGTCGGSGCPRPAQRQKRIQSVKTRARSVKTTAGKFFGVKGFNGRSGAARGRATAGTSAKRSGTTGPAGDAMRSRRKFYVFLSLVGLLTGTSALLL